jgi:FKBP-type peptidyl-prolyl cis-trans isomerase FklB
MNTPYKLIPVILLAGSVLSGAALARQDAPASPGQAPAAQTPPAPAAQPKAAPAAKSPKAATAAKPQAAATAKSPADAAAKAAPGTAAKPRPKAGTKATLPLTLKTEKDKQSYALGMNIGAGLQKQMADIDPEILSRGLKDSLAGRKTLLTDEDARTALTQLQNDMRKKQQEKVLMVSEGNKKTGQAFLLANKEKDGVVTLPSGLQYRILTAGTGPKPSATDTVVCNYRGTLLDGKEFDSSYKRGQPATFPVSNVIKGWTEALQLMPVGSKWQLFIPPDLAYGDRGAGVDIGPGSTLIFDVELVSIQEKPKQ